MKKLMALLLSLLLALSMPGCGAEKQPHKAADRPPLTREEREAREAAGIPLTVRLSDSQALQGKRIGCTIVYKGDEWCQHLSMALETLGRYYGAEITVEDGKADDDVQDAQLRQMTAEGVDMIMADPLTIDGTHDALMEAVEAEIPVIIYDGYWAHGREYAISTITWDQFETGRMVGRYFVDYVRAQMDGSCRVIEMANGLSAHCHDRFLGFHEIVDQANAEGCSIQILNRYDSQGSRESAYQAVLSAEEDYDMIVSDVDNGAMGAVQALRAMDRDSVKVLSMGAYGQEPFSLLHEEDPNYLACLNVDAWVLAESIMEAALDHFDGKEVTPVTNIPLYMVDAGNVDEFWSFS